MLTHRLARELAALALLSSAALAQDFSYPDFSSVAGLTLNGSAAQAGNALRVTPSGAAQKGSVYYDTPTRVTTGFTTTFTFQIGATSGGGADGMTFLLHNSVDGLAALGDDGSAMGYAENGTPGGAIENCLAIELDTWNSGVGDMDDNHVSIHTGGTGDNHYDEAYSLGQAKVAANMSDGAVHTAAIRYLGGTLEVFVDDLVNPLLSVPWDFVAGGTYVNGNPAGGLNLINGDSLTLGFTGGTGGAWEAHDVLSWTWNDAVLGTSFCGPASVNSTGASAVITGFGSEIVAVNDLTLAAALLPRGKFAVFLASKTAGFTGSYGGSQGNLCLGTGTFGYHASLVGNTGGAGTYSAKIDLTQVPTPAGPVAVVAGETWYWQCWFRDVNPGKTSNFTDGLAVTFL